MTVPQKDRRQEAEQGQASCRVPHPEVRGTGIKAGNASKFSPRQERQTKIKRVKGGISLWKETPKAHTHVGAVSPRKEMRKNIRNKSQKIEVTRTNQRKSHKEKEGKCGGRERWNLDLVCCVLINALQGSSRVSHIEKPKVIRMHESAEDEDKRSIEAQYNGSHSNSGRCQHPNERCADRSEEKLEDVGAEPAAPPRPVDSDDWIEACERDPWELNYYGRWRASPLQLRAREMQEGENEWVHTQGSVFSQNVSPDLRVWFQITYGPHRLMPFR